tara:strand:+ start:159 stop:788 length:630 start_codon:yes stop_codon:yes gene_type:complete
MGKDLLKVCERQWAIRHLFRRSLEEEKNMMRFLKGNKSRPSTNKMSRARRLVAKYEGSQISYKETSGWDMDSDSLTSVIEAYSKDKMIGEFEATVSLVDINDFTEYVCYHEMKELVTENPSLLRPDGKVYVVEVLSSFLDQDYRGRKIGTEGYLRLARYVFEKRTQRKPFLFIPNYCFASRTSDQALRVWKSLARRYPSKLDVIMISRP